MGLATFIEHSQEAIILEAVAFARTLSSFTHAEEAHVRNHLPDMLRAITLDLRTAQSTVASIAKSRGQAAAVAEASHTNSIAAVVRAVVLQGHQAHFAPEGGHSVAIGLRSARVTAWQLDPALAEELGLDPPNGELVTAQVQR